MFEFLWRKHKLRVRCLYAEGDFDELFKEYDEDDWKCDMVRMEESPIDGKRCLSTMILKNLSELIATNLYVRANEVRLSSSSLLLFVKFKFLLM